MDGAPQLGLDRSGLIDRLTDDVHDATERFVANRNHDGRASIANGLAPNEAFRNVHGDTADGVFTEVLRYFKDEAVGTVHRLKRVQDRRQIAVELDVDDGAYDLRDATGARGDNRRLFYLESGCLNRRCLLCCRGLFCR